MKYLYVFYKKARKKSRAFLYFKKCIPFALIVSSAFADASELMIPQELLQANSIATTEPYEIDKIQALFDEVATLINVEIQHININRLTEIQYVNSKVNAMEIRARLQQHPTKF